MLRFWQKGLCSRNVAGLWLPSLYQP